MTQSDSEILVRRARTLASARTGGAAAIDMVHGRYMVVKCGADRFAVALESVAEVFRPKSVTPLPRSIAPLWGLTSWRGGIVTVIVMGQCLPAQGTGVIIALTSDERVIAGLWADDVEGELAIGVDEIHAAQATSNFDESLVSGVTSDAKSILDVEGLARLLDKRGKEKSRAATDNSNRTKA